MLILRRMLESQVMMIRYKKILIGWAALIFALAVVPQYSFAQDQSPSAQGREVKDAHLAGHASSADTTIGEINSSRIENSSIENQPIISSNKNPRTKSSWSGKSMGRWGGSWLALAIVVAVILFSAYIFRKFWPEQQRWRNLAAIEILGKTHLSAKQSLCLVKLGKKILLLGICSDRITSLGQIEDPEQVTEMLATIQQNQSNSISSSFGKLFGQQASRYQSDPRASNVVGNSDSEVAELHEDHLCQEVRGSLGELLDRVDKLKGSKTLLKATP